VGTADDDVVAHYEAVPDDERITTGLGELELVRTKEIIRRHLGSAPREILDVGGGTGVHAAWLCRDGHRVHLVDVAPRHIAMALERPEAAAGRLTASVGDARRLDRDDASVDVVLLLGPLYHLVDAGDRRAALGEAFRVLRPGGMLAAAAVSRFASLFDGLARGYLFETEFSEIVAADLATGRHSNPTGHEHWWTTAYFHRPDELEAEIAAAGFAVDEVAGVEGIAPWIPRLAEDWSDPARRDVIIDAARRVEHEPAVLGVSPHLLAIAHRP
jgi:ubiquinone/menaquinone biosynthesis C-methylase UbiE